MLFCEAALLLCLKGLFCSSNDDDNKVMNSINIKEVNDVDKNKTLIITKQFFYEDSEHSNCINKNTTKVKEFEEMQESQSINDYSVHTKPRFSVFKYMQEEDYNRWMIIKMIKRNIVLIYIKQVLLQNKTGN